MKSFQGDAQLQMLIQPCDAVQFHNDEPKSNEEETERQAKAFIDADMN